MASDEETNIVVTDDDGLEYVLTKRVRFTESQWGKHEGGHELELVSTGDFLNDVPGQEGVYEDEDGKKYTVKK